MTALSMNHANPDSETTEGSPANRSLQCLLIVWGAPERLQHLLATFNKLDVEATLALSESGDYDKPFDLIIVDVESKYLARILETLRSKESWTQTPLWVESSRLYEDCHLAGVLSQYRAMPCSFVEMTKLLHLRLLPAISLLRSSSHNL